MGGGNFRRPAAVPEATARAPPALLDLHTTRRRRIRIALLTIFCLLFQQMAVAAYVCTLEAGPGSAVRVADCHQPVPERTELPDPVCAKHCAPDTATSAEARVLSVPAAVLPPLLHLPVLVGPGGDEVRLADASPAPDPPPRLRYARLLI